MNNIKPTLCEKVIFLWWGACWDGLGPELLMHLWALGPLKLTERFWRNCGVAVSVALARESCY